MYAIRSYYDRCRDRRRDIVEQRVGVGGRGKIDLYHSHLPAERVVGDGTAEGVTEQLVA